MDILYAIVELILIPYCILLVLSMCEQWIEPIAFDDRFMKSLWDTEILCLGAQGGFVFRATSTHSNPPTDKWAWLCFATIAALTVCMALIRKHRRYKDKEPRGSAFQDGAFCMATVSIVIPMLYVLTSH